MNAVAGDFLHGGISPDLTHFAMHALGTRIWGYSAEAFNEPDAPTTADAENPALMDYMVAKFPHVVTIAMDTATRNPGGACDEDAEFAFTLDLLLDAFARLHHGGWISRSPA